MHDGIQSRQHERGGRQSYSLWHIARNMFTDVPSLIAMCIEHVHFLGVCASSFFHRLQNYSFTWKVDDH